MTATDEPKSVPETAFLQEEALTDESSLEKLMLRGNIAALPAAVVGHQTDWDGLTPDQEAARKHKNQEDEYERTMEQVRRRSEELMRRLDEQEREVHKKMAEADSRAIVLRDGRRVLVGRNGEYIDEESGRKLEGGDKAEAERKRTATSETEEERNNLKKQLAQIEAAREHARNADDLASANGNATSAATQKENATQAQRELAAAEAATHEIAYVDPGADGDAAAALGLASVKGERSPSFAASLDGKDRSVATVRPEFAARSNPPIPALSSDAQVSASTKNRNQVPQPV